MTRIIYPNIIYSHSWSKINFQDVNVHIHQQPADAGHLSAVFVFNLYAFFQLEDFHLKVKKQPGCLSAAFGFDNYPSWLIFVFSQNYRI